VTAPGVYRPDQIIRDAAKHGELVVFVGAGASMLCGSPDWRDFANQVVGALEKARNLSFLEAEQLRGLGDSRRTLSIALALAKEQGLEIDFDNILHPARPKPIGTELYERRVPPVARRLGEAFQSALQRGVSAPSEAWRFLPGASPGRERDREDFS